MATPIICMKAPVSVELNEGQSYYWCACGLSQTQPFCDGTHKEAAEFTPVKYTADKDGPVRFCMCKHSAKQPLCDGSHNKL
jgi:CDGSH-type Zn-finger protein